MICRERVQTRTKGARNYKELWSWIRALCIPALCVLLLNTFIFKLVIVDGDSMYPTLYNHNILIVRQILYTPAAGDVVIISSKSLPIEDNYIVKRIIAVEGQTVVIDYNDNTVSVDDQIISEPYLNNEQADPLHAGSEEGIDIYEVRQGQVFVMGDNRNFSIDSRDDRIGMVSQEDVRGGILVNIPLGRILS